MRLLETTPARNPGAGVVMSGCAMAKLRMLRPRLTAVDLRRVKPAAKVAEPFYSSAEWIALRDQVRREAKWMCQAPGCTRRGHIVDHIVEIKDGGAPLDRGNLRNLCSPHHGEKTARERAKRMAQRYN